MWMEAAGILAEFVEVTLDDDPGMIGGYSCRRQKKDAKEGFQAGRILAPGSAGTARQSHIRHLGDLDINDSI
jgi:hypothetical protein